jgi:hypothetical protein
MRGRFELLNASARPGTDTLVVTVANSVDVYLIPVRVEESDEAVLQRLWAFDPAPYQDPAG